MKKLMILFLALFTTNFACAQNQPTKTTLLKFQTTQGTFEVKLFPDVAPKACENMTALAKMGFYDGLIFHRVIPGFMIQGGDPEGTGRGGKSVWGEDFQDEFNPSVTFDKPGLLAMANRGPNTNGGQFFITLVPTPWLDNKHSVFGEVVTGMEIIEKIGAVATSKPGDRPLKPITIQSVVIERT